MKLFLQLPQTFKILLLVSTAFFSASVLSAQNNEIPELKRYPFSKGYESPLGIEHAGDNRLFIVERGGKIWIATLRGKKKAAPFLDISDRITTAGGEQGLLGLAFDPDYKSNGYFYVNYTNPEGDTHISRFKVSDDNPDMANEDSEIVLLTQEQPFTNHNGGQIKFGPDNYLYIALGDGGSAGDPLNNAQNPSTFLGKMLRIDVDSASGGKMYSIPEDNPYVGMAGYLEEIWATGLRNPFRFSFDRKEGDLWIADVGQDSWEEVNYQMADSEGGENYGWSCWEGNHAFKADCDLNDAPLVYPIVEYPHNSDPCSGTVIGGYVYRGRLFSNMYGKYFYADYCKGTIGTIFQENSEWVNKELVTFNPFSYTSFGENWIGELFLADASKGIIYLLYDGSDLPAGRVLDSEKVSIYPNPATENFTIKVNTSKQDVYQLKILDQMGQIVYTASKVAETGVNEWEISVDSFKPGLWFLKVESSKGTVNKRFFIY